MRAQVEDGLNETSETPSARAFGFGFALLKKKRGERRFFPLAREFRLTVRRTSLSLSRTIRSVLFGVALRVGRVLSRLMYVCVYARRARFAAASKRVLRCNKSENRAEKRKSENAYAESDTRDQKSVAATVLCFAGNSSLYCGTCHFCVTGNAYALCVHHLFPHFFHTGRALTNGAEKELLLPLVIRHLGVSLSETRDNQIFAE